MICSKCKGNGFVRVNGHWVYPKHGQPHFAKGYNRKCPRCKGAGFIVRVIHLRGYKHGNVHP